MKENDQGRSGSNVAIITLNWSCWFVETIHLMIQNVVWLVRWVILKNLIKNEMITWRVCNTQIKTQGLYKIASISMIQ